MPNPACAEVDPEIFFDPELVPLAKAICAACPAIAECAAELARLNAQLPASASCQGVWAGTTYRERRAAKEAARHKIQTHQAA